jgi:hypothetical protein
METLEKLVRSIVSCKIRTMSIRSDEFCRYMWYEPFKYHVYIFSNRITMVDGTECDPNNYWETIDDLGKIVTVSFGDPHCYQKVRSWLQKTQLTQ